MHIAYVHAVHANKKVIFVIVALFELNGTLALAEKTVLCKLGFGRRIDGVADIAPYLFRACGAG